MGATPLEIKKSNEALFMRRLYEATDGDYLVSVDWDELTEGMNLSEEKTWILVVYLMQEGLIESGGMGKRVNITHAGVVEVRQSLENPNKATEHFPPAATINIINSSVSCSSIAQASANVNQTAIYTGEQRQDLQTVLDQVRNVLDQNLLDAEDSQVVRADIQTVEAQIESPRPNDTIIQASLTSILNVLAVMGGDNQLIQAVVEALRPFLST